MITELKLKPATAPEPPGGYMVTKEVLRDGRVTYVLNITKDDERNGDA